MKPYMFLGSSYYDLNTLGNAMAVHFDQACEDIFAHAKQLVKFVRRCNKKMTKEVISILADSRYKNDAITFLIFNFTKDKKILINGKSYTFRTFVEDLKNYPDTFNALYAFMADLGITKTFARVTNEKFLAEDAYYIDMNINDPFVYKYLTTYYDFVQTESLHGQIQSVAIADEECFRRASKIMRNETYKLSLAHKFGFKAVWMMHIAVNPLFDGIKLIVNETDETTLKKLVSDGFFWWMLDNFDHYSYKGEAKYIERRFSEEKATLAKYNKMVEKKKVDQISMTLYIDMSKTLYLLYLDFIEYFQEGYITTKGEDAEKYEMNKPYCKTLICEAYMQGRVIKLYKPHEKKVEAKHEILEHIADREAEEEQTIDVESELENFDPNAHTEDLDNLQEAEKQEEEKPEKKEDIPEEKPFDFDDDSDDEPRTLHNRAPMYREKLKGQRATLRALKTYAGMSAFFGVVLLLADGFFLLTAFASNILASISPSLYVEAIEIMCTNLQGILLPVGIAMGVSAILSFALGLTLSVRAGKSLSYLESYIAYDNLTLVERLTPHQADRLNELRPGKDIYIEEGLKNHRSLSAFLVLFCGIMFGMMGVYLSAMISSLGSIGDFSKISMIVLACGFAGGILGLIYGYAEKKKGFWSFLMVAIISAGIPFALMMILGK